MESEGRAREGSNREGSQEKRRESRDLLGTLASPRRLGDTRISRKRQECGPSTAELGRMKIRMASEAGLTFFGVEHS